MVYLGLFWAPLVLGNRHVGGSKGGQAEIVRDGPFFGIVLKFLRGFVRVCSGMLRRAPSNIRTWQHCAAGSDASSRQA